MRMMIKSILFYTGIVLYGIISIIINVFIAYKLGGIIAEHFTETILMMILLACIINKITDG